MRRVTKKIDKCIYSVLYHFIQKFFNGQRNFARAHTHTLLCLMCDVCMMGIVRCLIHI